MKFLINEIVSDDPYLIASVNEIPEEKPEVETEEFKAIIDSIKELSLRIIKESPNIPSEAGFAIKNIESNAFLINFISSNMNLNVKDEQTLLDIKDLSERAMATLKHMDMQMQKLSLKNDIQSKVRNDLDQQQREYFLHQPMKTIHEELGGNPLDQEIEEFTCM